MARSTMERSYPTSRLTRPQQAMPSFVRNALKERGLTDAYRARPPKAKRLQQILDELERGDRYMKMVW